MEDYKIRFINEYKELKERHSKLRIMLCKYYCGTLDFEPTCPICLLEEQAVYMFNYLKVLERRAEIEKVDLED